MTIIRLFGLGIRILCRPNLLEKYTETTSISPHSQHTLEHSPEIV